jgi:hypothetical protein
LLDFISFTSYLLLKVEFGNARKLDLFCATEASSTPSKHYYVTVKTAELVAVPPGVVIAIFPVFAPVGTFAVTCVSELTTTVVALTPPNVSFVVFACEISSV